VELPIRTGSPDSVTSHFVIPTIYESADISDILDSTVRYVVYITAALDDDEGRLQTIALQKIDGITEQKIGDPILLAKDAVFGS
jgi:hypothetical protein